MIQNSLLREQSPPKQNYPFQIMALRETLNEFERGVTSTALVMATGTGKTFVFTQIAKEFIRRYQKPVLILAHRTELVEQIENTLRDMDIQLVREQAGASALSGGTFDAVVACTPSIAQKKRLEQFPSDMFSLIITDEAHHAVCSENRRIYDHFAETKHLGVTATPLRHDRVGLKNVFQTVSFQYPIAQGIEEGFLCKLQAKRVKVQELELESVSGTKTDFSSVELDALLMKEEVLSKMVIPTIEHVGNRQTIVFTHNLEHARQITACFNRQGNKIIATNIDSSLAENERRTRLNRYKNGEVQFIVNVGVLTEGFDHPPTSCIALFRPTKSLGLLAQMVGRGTRIYEGKSDCLILDFVGVNNSVRTMSVFDVLDGTILSDREHTKAVEFVEAGLTTTEALAEAKIEIAKLEAMEIQWKAISKSNPFDIMKLFAIPSRKGLYGGALATFAQRSLLELKGIKTPATLEQAEAAGLLKELDHRSRNGLASFKQLKMVKRYYTDFDPQTLTRNHADKMIQDALRERGMGHLVDTFQAKRYASVR